MRFIELLDSTIYTLKALEEDFLEFSARLEFNEPSNLAENLLVLTNSVSPRDICTIKLSEIGSESTLIQNFEIEHIQAAVDEVVLYADEKNFELTISIKKQQDSQTVSVYDFRAFINRLCELNLSSALSVFSDYLAKGNGSLRFNCFDLDNEVGSDTIGFFKWDNNNASSPDLIFRGQVYSKINENCHLVFDGTIELLPEDFYFKSSDIVDFSLRQFIDRLKLVLSVGAIFNTTKVSGNEFLYRIIGYKTIAWTEKFDSVSVSNGPIYYQIYQWIYNGGNVSDKIGLVRNVLTLHLVDNSLQLIGDPLLAIKSSYDIYLKQNIKQYLEVRKDIGSQLISLSNETSRIASNFVSSFEKSFIAFLGYFLSVFLARIFKSGSLEQVFNYETWFIGIGLLFVSLLFLLYSNWAFSDEIKRYKHRYDNLKERFKDLLGEDDIKRILDGDKEYKGSLEYLTSRRSLFRAFWLISLLIFLVAITWLWILFEISR